MSKKWNLTKSSYRLTELAKAMTNLDVDIIEYATKFKLANHGEGIFLDETECWKRVLQQRISDYYKPKCIIETHKGLGIGTYIYNRNNPEIIISCKHDFKSELKVIKTFEADLIDIDPYGFCYESIEETKRFLKNDTLLCITSGEIMNVSRNLPNIKLKTGHFGKETSKWIPYFIEHIESFTNIKVQFYYASNVIIRLFCSNKEIEKSIFKDVPNLMSWIKKY